MIMHRGLAWIVGDSVHDLSAIHFEFNVPFGTSLCLLLLVGMVFAVTYYCWPRLSGTAKPLRMVLTGLRTVVILLVLLLLFDPCLVGDLQKPGDQYIALLFDDSYSMRVNNDHGQTRGKRLQEAYQQNRSSFEEKLAKKFRLVKFRFGGGIETLPDIQQLDFTQNASDLIQAVHSVHRELEGLTVPAILLFSDGVQQTGGFTQELTLQSLLPGPVFTVGVGEEEPWRDLRINRLSVSRTSFDQSPVVINAEIGAQGFQGKEARAVVMRDGKIIQTQTFSITENRQNVPFHFQFIPKPKEWLEYKIHVRALLQSGESEDSPEDETLTPEERTPQNNTRSFLVDNTDKHYRILYYSSRPNWEQKFVRRALQDDDQLQLSSLILISRAQRKFVFRGAKTTLTNPLFEGFDNDPEQFGRYDEPVYLRLGLGETELANGFPAKKEDLFPFHLLIIGDVDWTDFSTSQLKLIRDFVDQRGGSLLFLGGKEKFTSETFLNSPLVSLLPVIPSNFSNPEETFLSDFFSVIPTANGELIGAWSLDADPKENQKRWNEMPELFGLNRFAVTRPGATIFSQVQNAGSGRQQPFFITQRYGNGQCAVLAADDTWPWRMGLEENSNAHERLWRQWMRSLVEKVPEPVQLLSTQDSYLVDQPNSFRFRIRNPQFEDQENARTSLTIQTPSRKEDHPALEESLQENGIYTSEWTPVETGKTTMTVTVSNASKELVDTWSQAFLADENRREFDHAQYDPAFLQNLAGQTHGKFFPLNRLAEIPDAIPWTTGQEATKQKIHLWHIPLFYFLFILLLSLEWFLRRRHGHP